MRSFFHRILLLLAASLLTGLTASPACAVLINGDFGAPLGPGNWTAAGAASISSGSGLLADGNPATGSRLFQGAAYGSGTYRIGFDFLPALSSQVPFGSFADTFFASLYFIDDLTTFDPDALVFDGSAALLSVDHSGVFDVNGNVGASARGGDWQHFSLIFSNTNQYIIPFFELIDLNGIGGDSSVLVDDVTIEAFEPIVPEPATWIMAGLGLLTLAATRRRIASLERIR